MPVVYRKYYILTRLQFEYYDNKMHIISGRALSVPNVDKRLFCIWRTNERTKEEKEMYAPQRECADYTHAHTVESESNAEDDKNIEKRQKHYKYSHILFR